jgi:flavin reductase (DIM6/NTAB) family NADH-FMN oxidoreductase RutF
MDCRLDATNDAGDHLIFIGEVLASAWSPKPSRSSFTAAATSS